MSTVYTARNKMRLDSQLVLHVMSMCVCISHQLNSVRFLRFSRHLSGSQFRVIYSVSVLECLHECLARPLCKSFNYRRRILHCGLNVADITISQDNLSTSPGNVFSQKFDWDESELQPDCSVCANGTFCDVTSGGAASCVVRECGILSTVVHGHVLGGNLAHVGARVAYTCTPDYINIGSSAMSTCGETGVWSTPDMLCAHTGCFTAPPVPAVTTNQTAMIQYNCTMEHIGRGSSAPCNLDTGQWTTFYSECCDVDGGPWTLVYRITTGGGAYIVKFWVNATSPTNLANCQFRRPDIINNWQNAGITHVKVELLKNNATVKHLLFNGTGTDNNNWFISTRLINSSWSDLQQVNTNEFTLTINGMTFHHINRTTNIRWFATQQSSVTNCSANIGWFGVGSDLYPCDGPQFTSVPSIVYATGDGADTFDAANIALADKMEISVKVT